MGRQAERQEVAWACARALRPRACILLSEEEDDRDGCGGGLGCYSRRPGKWAQVSFCLSIYFCFGCNLFEFGFQNQTILCPLGNPYVAC